ncbi:MAG: leucine-rich repeat domain-containing protein [Treponema sp.]|nr:leucine-rich repeat domain-containing protein [Treponema sp.]
MSAGVAENDLIPKLRSVTIPEGVTTIDDDAFTDCINLTTVTLPKSLKTITIPAGITEIGAWVFQNSGLTTLVDHRYLPRNDTAPCVLG